MAGPGKSLAGPSWSTNADGANSANLQAPSDMTSSMVNLVSKHRSHWERPKSPPGFWRSDFPNTQEVAEDRQKAAERSKQEAKNRLSEVMGGGGRKRSRYMFRDPKLRELVFKLFD